MKETLRIKQHYGRVLLIKNGRCIAELPWQAADDVANALKAVARKAEEWHSAERIASDQALLIRAGAPFGLSNEPLILGEAVKQAVHDRKLRRALPGGVKSKEVFGTPSIIQNKPR